MNGLLTKSIGDVLIAGGVFARFTIAQTNNGFPDAVVRYEWNVNNKYYHVQKNVNMSDPEAFKLALLNLTDIAMQKLSEQRANNEQ